MNMEENALNAFIERFQVENGEITNTDIDYVSDELIDLADSLVPVYDNDIVEEWVAAGMPEMDSADDIPEGAGILDQMRTALYEQYYIKLEEIAEAYGLVVN